MNPLSEPLPHDARSDATVALMSNTGIVQTGSGNIAIQGERATLVERVNVLNANSVTIDGDGAAGAATLLRMFQENQPLAALFQSALVVSQSVPAIPCAPPVTTDTFLHHEIDRYRNVHNAGDPATALKLLEAMLAANGHAADTVRFRILTNIGAARLLLNRLPEAAAAFKEAYPLNPEDENALSNLVLAHTILGDQPAARRVARHAVALFPAQPVAWGWVVATVDEHHRDAPSMVAPKALHDTAAVTFAIGRTYARRDATISEALVWMAKAYLLDPTNSYTLEALGELHLRQAAVPGTTGENLVFRQPFTAAQHAAIARAQPFFQRAWALSAGTPAASLNHTLLLNLAVTHLLLGDPAKAGGVLDQIDARDRPDIGRLRAYLAMEREDWPAALKMLDSLPIEASADQTIMRAQALAKCNRMEEALALLDVTLARLSGDPVRDTAQLLYLALLEERDGVEAARDAAHAFVAAGTRSVQVLIQLAVLEHANGADAEAEHWFAAAKAACAPDRAISEGIALGVALLRTGRVTAGIAVLETLPLPDADTPEVRHLIGSLLDTDQRAAAQTRLDRLPATVRNQPFFQRAEAVLRGRRGDPDGAVQLLDDYLQAHPDDVAMRLYWIQMQEQRGRTNDVAAVLDGMLERTARGSLAHRMLLAQVLARYGRSARAWAFAYDIRRSAKGDGTDDGAAHRGYISLGLMGPGAKALTSEMKRDVIGTDTAFTVADEAGERTYVIETAADRNFEAGELAPSHAVARAAIGRRVGDTVTLPGPRASSQEARITAIKHKYLHALHVSMDRHRERFPDQAGPWSLQLVRDGSPEDILAPLLPLLDERRAWCEEVEEQYRTGVMPLALMAELLGVHAIDAWSGLAHPGHPPVLTCDGNPWELRAARAILRAGKGVVVDPVTLTHIVALDAADAVIAVTGRLGLTRSTIDSLRRLVEERRLHGKRGHLSIGLGEHGLVRHHVSASDIAMNIAFLERVIEFAESQCDVILAQAPEDPPAELADWLAHIRDPAYHDTLLAARGSGRTLLSDDLALRRWASAFLSDAGVWTGSALWMARARGHLPPAAHAALVLKVARSRHSFTTVDAIDLLAILERDGWRASEEFQYLVRLLTGDTVDLGSAVRVIRQFVDRLWAQAIPEESKRRGLWGVLNTLLEPRQRLWGLVVNNLLKHDLIGVRGAIILWSNGHFLNVPGMVPQPAIRKGKRRRPRA